MVPYLNDPKRVFGQSPPFKLVVGSKADPEFSEPSGECSLMSKGQSGTIVINSGKRAVLVLNLGSRPQKGSFNSSSGPNKYSTIPHPFFELDKSALPVGVTPEMLKLARDLFSSSVTSRTQSKLCQCGATLKKSSG